MMQGFSKRYSYSSTAANAPVQGILIGGQQSNYVFGACALLTNLIALSLQSGRYSLGCKSLSDSVRLNL
jgi:hypothetical protein